MMQSSLRRLLLGWLIVPLSVLLLVGTFAAFRVAFRMADSAYDHTLKDAALAIANQVQVHGGQATLNFPPEAQRVLLTDKYDKLFYLVVGPNKEFIAGNRDLPQSESESLAPNRPYYDSKFHGEPVRVAVLYTHLGPGRITVYIAETLVKRHKLIEEIIFAMLLPVVLLALAVIALVWFGVARGLLPLERLRQEISSRSPKDLRPVPEEHAPREVRPLMHALNQLMERFGRTLSAQQRFLANAAHQLRTPLAGLQTQIELAMRQFDNPAELRHTLDILHSSVERTTRLTNQLLVMARAEAGDALPDARQSIDLSERVKGIADEWVRRALTYNVDLGFELETAPLEGIPLLLQELLANLLDNAIRYSGSGGQVTVRTYLADGHAVLEVEDDGPGVPSAERQNVFERFYRIAGSQGEGCGLGLAIVAEIAHAHNASVELAEPVAGKGALFVLKFPAVEAALLTPTD